MLSIRHMLHGMMVVLLAASALPAAEQAQQSSKENKSKSERVGQQDKDLENTLAEWLMCGNLSEVELGEMAAERTQNPAVKDFAQRMVHAHSAYWQKLTKFTTNPNQTIAQAKAKVESHTAQNKSSQRGNVIRGRSAFRGGEFATLDEIGARAGELKIQMTKNLLKDYKGRDFDMAYIGDQIAAHIQILANLKAVEEYSTGDFKEAVEEGIQVTESHLKRAKEISTQLKPGGGSAKNSNR